MPWQLGPEEESGFWQFNGTFVMPITSTGDIVKIVPTWKRLVEAFDAAPAGYSPHPVMRDMLGGFYEIVDINRDGFYGLLCPDGFLRHVPPAVAEIQKNDLAAAAPTEIVETVAPTPVNRSAEVPVIPPPPIMPASTSLNQPSRTSGLSIGCWSIPGEADLCRIERVVRHFVESLQAEGVALPENIHLIGPCRELQHKGCFVYRFGTRRLHLSTRPTDDDRLVLVVRWGGGFMDFLDFARRHG